MSELDSAEAVKLTGSWSARAWHMLIKSQQVDHMHAMVLLAMAHHRDLLDALNKSTITYPEDIADLVGISPNRAGGIMRELARYTGLVAGTAQAGYSLGEWEI